MAWVDWHAAVTAVGTGRLVCTRSEAGMLQIAASIAEGVPVALGDMLGGLDQDNVLGVLQAVLHATGGRDAATRVRLGR